MVILGVDPGIRHTGWAIVTLPERRVLAIGTVREKEWAKALHTIGDATAGYLGDVGLVAVNVPAIEGVKAAFWAKSGKRSEMSIVKNGGCSGEVCGWFLAKGFRVVKVLSKRGMGMKMAPKLWAAYWGYDGRCSEDARDAAQIALIGAEELR